jgi:hypothetical protein
MKPQMALRREARAYLLPTFKTLSVSVVTLDNSDSQ